MVGVHGRHGLDHRLRIGKADIFAAGDDETPQEGHRIHAELLDGIEEPEQRGVARAAHALVKGGQDVILRRLVRFHDGAADRLFRHLAA